MVGDILEFDDELTIRLSFRSRLYGKPEYHYIQLLMADGKKKKLYPEVHLPMNMDCKKLSDMEAGEYEYTAAFHPRNILLINEYGGCSQFINQIQMIEDFYITESETEKEYKDADFVGIQFEYDGKTAGGIFA